MIQRRVIDWVDNFDRAQTPTTTPGPNGWTLTKTAAGGSPTMAITTLGLGMVITLAATNEIENMCLSHNDILTFPTIGLQRFEWTMNLSAMAAASTVSFGFGTARNDAIASVTSFAGFRILGSGSLSNVLIDCRDGTNSKASIATGKTLGATNRMFAVDFTNGLADIRFEIDGSRVAAGTVFSMAALTSTSFLQPLVQVQKTAATDVPALGILRLAIQYKQTLVG